MARDFKAKVRLEAEDRASKEIGKVESRFSRMTNTIKANALKITAALGTVILLFRQLREASALEGQTDALKRNLAAQGLAFDGFIAKLKEVSDAQVSTADLIRSSGKALLLGIPAEQIAALLDVARASAIATGDSITKAFEDITTGIGRASPLILDNLGIVVKLGPAYDKYAASIGKATDALTPMEQKQALLNEVLEVGRERVEAFGDAQGELAKRLQQGNAAMDNFTDGATKLLSGVVLAGAAILARFSESFVLLARGIALAITKIAELGALLPGIGGSFEAIATRSLQIDAALGRVARSMEKTANEMSQAADVQLSALLGLDKGAVAAVDLAKKLDEASKSMTGLGGSATATTSAVVELGNALGVVTSAELSKEITELEQSLAAARDELGLNSREYVRLEEIAGAKIEALRGRVQSLKDGLGDLTTETGRVVDAFGTYGEGADTARERTDALTLSLGRQQGQLQLTREELERTAAAAVGGRIQLEGGGSILANPGAPLFPSVGGGTFTRIDPLPAVAADGTVTIPPVVGPYFGIA